MMDDQELRLRMALWLHRTWPYRLIANARMHCVPQQRGLGKLKSNTGENLMPSTAQIQLAYASIADSERAENSLGTRVDAAIQAITALNQFLLRDPILQRYQEQKYQRPLDALELQAYHVYALTLAKALLLAAEPSSASVTEAWPESAADLLDALRNGPPTQINLFGKHCSPEEAAAVLDSTDPLQAARDLIAKRLNEWGSSK